MITKKTIFHVEIKRRAPNSLKNSIAIVNQGMDSNHYAYFTDETDKIKLENSIKKAMAKELGVNVSKITEYILLPRKTGAMLRIET